MNDTSKFGIIIKAEGNIAKLYLSGYLDAHTASELENALNQIIIDNKYYILVNFKNLDYISSAGLGVFMAFIEEIRDKNGDIKLCEMTSKVFQVFDLLGFPILFDILDTEDEAIQKFKNGDLKKNE
ncbi:anti-sigma factor antagonist [Bacteroidetes/Chlorobi group bacterium ChocPot_Mid]|jgi:anti-sigma B factor antagonist|nr:MAG: anti-sigma factor antagonist [Bacteroidetes/Chlorobi group bacterium ChocPot_Mid]